MCVCVSSRSNALLLRRPESAKLAPQSLAAEEEEDETRRITLHGRAGARLKFQSLEPRQLVPDLRAKKNANDATDLSSCALLSLHTWTPAVALSARSGRRSWESRLSSSSAFRSSVPTTGGRRTSSKPATSNDCRKLMLLQPDDSLLAPFSSHLPRVRLE